jgi:hypothetical protein
MTIANKLKTMPLIQKKISPTLESVDNNSSHKFAKDDPMASLRQISNMVAANMNAKSLNI